MECDGAEEAVELVNGSRYGLSDAVFARDLRTAVYFGEHA